MRQAGVALLLCCWLVVGFPLTTRAQYGVSATLSGVAGKQVRLSRYTGLDTQEVGTVVADAQGSFTFPPLPATGMFFLESGDWQLELLSTGHPVQFVMGDPDDLASAQFVNSPENATWTAYLIERNAYRHNSEALKTVLRQYDPASEFYQTAKNEYFKVYETYRHHTDSLIALRPDYASRLIRADREIAVDPSLTGQEQRMWLLDNYLEEVDFNDLELIPTNVLTTKMLDYLSVTQGLKGLEDPELAFVVGLDRLFDKAKVNMKMYGFVLEYMLQGFTALGLSRVTDYLLNYPQLAEGEITAEEASVLESLTEPYQKVRVGAKAPDLSDLTLEGEPYRLYDSQAPWTLVVFWAVDCEYCHDFLTQIRKKLDLENEFELVTIALGDSREEVEEELESLRLERKGRHFYDERRWDGKMFLDYHVTSTPTVFLLDRDKNIVCKPYDWNELKLFLKNNKQ